MLNDNNGRTHAWPLVSPKFLHVPVGVGGWPLGYEEQRCWANCLLNLFPRFSSYVVMIHQRHRRTDDMRSQDRTLHYSASRGRNRKSNLQPHSRSLAILPFDRPYILLYYSSIVTMSILHHVWDIIDYFQKITEVTCDTWPWPWPLKNYLLVHVTKWPANVQNLKCLA